MWTLSSKNTFIKNIFITNQIESWDRTKEIAMAITWKSVFGPREPGSNRRMVGSGQDGKRIAHEVGKPHRGGAKSDSNPKAAITRQPERTPDVHISGSRPFEKHHQNSTRRHPERDKNERGGRKKERNFVRRRRGCV